MDLNLGCRYDKPVFQTLEHYSNNNLNLSKIKGKVCDIQSGYMKSARIEFDENTPANRKDPHNTQHTETTMTRTG